MRQHWSFLFCNFYWWGEKIGKVWTLCKKGSIPPFTLNLFQELNRFQPEKTAAWIEPFQLHALFLPDPQLQMEIKYFNSSEITLKPDLWQGTISTLMHLTSAEICPLYQNQICHLCCTGFLVPHLHHIHRKIKCRDDLMVISFSLTYAKDKQTSSG